MSYCAWCYCSCCGCVSPVLDAILEHLYDYYLLYAKNNQEDNNVCLEHYIITLRHQAFCATCTLAVIINPNVRLHHLNTYAYSYINEYINLHHTYMRLF